VRVVEAASYVSGPFTGLMLAHLGAEVVKVEPPKGDPFRNFGLRHHGVSAMWVNINHGKTITVVDLKTAEGHELMLGLLRGADVFIENWRPGVAASLGYGDDVLDRVNPGLIHLAITGFGETGPKAGEPVFDMLLQASSGLAALESSDERPTPVRSFIADKATAAFAAQSVLAALFERTQTGRGRRIDVAMLDVMAYFNFPDLCQDRTFLPPARRVDIPRGRSGILRTKDGYVGVSPVSGRQIAAAVTAAGHPEWKDELKVITNPTTLTNELYDRLETVTPSRTTEEWLEIFRDNDVPATAALTADQHFEDPQTIHNALYSQVDTPLGPVRRVRYPSRLDRRLLAEVPPTEGIDPPRAGRG
jgi:crotonobetainyl-CoA:carnitine CoA-transferase CaiB-like acyl-CoA transferase